MFYFTNNDFAMHFKYLISDKIEERTGGKGAKEKGKSGGALVHHNKGCVSPSLTHKHMPIALMHAWIQCCALCLLVYHRIYIFWKISYWFSYSVPLGCTQWGSTWTDWQGCIFWSCGPWQSTKFPYPETDNLQPFQGTSFFFVNLYLEIVASFSFLQPLLLMSYIPIHNFNILTCIHKLVLKLADSCTKVVIVLHIVKFSTIQLSAQTCWLVRILLNFKSYNEVSGFILGSSHFIKHTSFLDFPSYAPASNWVIIG